MENCTFNAMGTTINLQIEHKFAKDLLIGAKSQLLNYEQRFSANDKTSSLMEVNRSAGKHEVKVDKDLFDLIQFGKKYSLDTSNTLNITIGPLVKLWKIGFSDARVPTQVEIDRCCELINPEYIRLDEENQSVFLEKEGMEIDLGSLAKGYFTDKIRKHLVYSGVERGIIDLGGNVLVFGSHPKNKDGLWRVGIQDPFKGRHNLVGIVKVKDASVVTSGIYERHLAVDNEEYHHIFDSRTGYPIKNDIASVTVLSKESLFGELYTTMFYQYDSSEIIEIINRIPNTEAIVISRENKLLLSNNIGNLFIATN